MTGKHDPQGSGGAVNAALRQLQQWPDWLALLPMAVLVVAILVLAAYSTSITFKARDIERTTNRVNVPALRSSLDLIVATTLELEELQQYAITADTVDVLKVLENAEARERAMVRLEPVTPQLTAEARRQSEDLLRNAHEWEATLPTAAEVAQLDPETREARLSESRDQLRGMLVYAASLHAVIRTEVDSARAELAASERRVWHFTLGLAGLALLATLLVIWLIRRVRRLAEMSRRRRIQAETAMENRSRLIRGITHDLKNPLAAADGNAQLLEMGVVGQLTDAQETTVGRIRRGIAGALGIVSDLLELSRAESGRLEIAVCPTDLAPILRDATDDFALRADAAGIILEIDVPPELPYAVTDGARVRQIVANLLSNALEHTPSRGRVDVVADVRPEHGKPRDRPWLAVAVADTGRGIRPEEHERIFEEFYRATAPAGGATSGLGLGLAISRRIARLLGGDITVESELGKGSVFTLWLPLDEDAAGSRFPVPRSQFRVPSRES